MSKRFGRNQKRAMLQKISVLEVKLRSEAMDSRLLRRKCEEYADAIKITAQVLGKNFVGLQPEELMISSPDQDCRIPVMRPIGSCTPEMLMQNILTLRNSKFSGVLDRLRDCVHFRYRTAGGEIGYSISRETWSMLPEASRYEIALREVTREMAKFLAKNPEMLERA